MAAKQTALTVEMLEASEINEVRIGGKVKSLSVKDGTQRTTKEGEPMINPDGSPLLWPDSHFVEFAFQGGIATFRVSSEIYSTLEEGKRYQLVGVVFMKTPFGDGKPYPAIEPKAFKFLF